MNIPGRHPNLKPTFTDPFYQNHVLLPALWCRRVILPVLIQDMKAINQRRTWRAKECSLIFKRFLQLMI